MANYIGVWFMGVVMVPEALLEKLEPMIPTTNSSIIQDPLLLTMVSFESLHNFFTFSILYIRLPAQVLSSLRVSDS